MVSVDIRLNLILNFTNYGSSSLRLYVIYDQSGSTNMRLNNSHNQIGNRNRERNDNIHHTHIEKSGEISEHTNSRVEGVPVYGSQTGML